MTNVVNIFKDKQCGVNDSTYEKKADSVAVIPNDMNLEGFLITLQSFLSLSPSGAYVIDVRDGLMNIRIKYFSEFNEVDEVDFYDCLEFGSTFALSDTDLQKNLDKLRVNIKELDLRQVLRSKKDTDK